MIITLILCAAHDGAPLIVAHAVCSLYGADKAKTNFPASEYSHYLGALAANAMAAPPTEPLANASQLVEELQQVVSPALANHHERGLPSARQHCLSTAWLHVLLACSPMIAKSESEGYVMLYCMP